MMKQQLLKVLSVCMAVAFLPQVAHAGDVEINTTNFPDKNFRNYLLQEYGNYGKDGILTEEEIKDITYLNVRDKGIHSLQGIEYLTALTWQDCSNNQLTALDVSKNTALTWLVCDDNQLTSLDVSKNTVLNTLYCGGNQLTSLDVSKNTALGQLGCSANQLTSLDVSKNIGLVNLHCHNNQLTSLDISKNTALEILACSTNQLTSLDVSKNTVLNTLFCGDNQLTSLDISKNTALTSLECGGNQLTALDVSKNTALRDLACSNNQLTALAVSKNTALTVLSCNNNQIKGTSMDNLINSLPTQKWAARLYVYSSLSSDEGNVCTKEQVKAAKEKGWTVYYAYVYDEFGYELWQEYEGSDDTAIDGIRTEAGKDAPIYNLRGQRLTAPQKGINIIGGRKVIVK